MLPVYVMPRIGAMAAYEEGRQTMTIIHASENKACKAKSERPDGHH